MEQDAAASGHVLLERKVLHYNSIPQIPAPNIDSKVSHCHSPDALPCSHLCEATHLFVMPTPDKQLSTGNGTRTEPLSWRPNGSVGVPAAAGSYSHNPLKLTQDEAGRVICGLHVRCSEPTRGKLAAPPYRAGDSDNHSLVPWVLGKNRDTRVHQLAPLRNLVGRST